MPEASTIECLVACDGAAGTRLLRLAAPAGSTVAAVLAMAQPHWPELQRELQTARVGIWGQECGRERLLQDGDRVEIYRELLHDPKEARRQRVTEAARSQRALRRRER
jgi:putative ubiquitin-RnfH superfamily antitoxin RatB of RatAB toxin-antitoxin module